MRYFLDHPFEFLVILLAGALIVFAWTIFDLRKKWNRIFRSRKPNDALGDLLERVVHLEHLMANIEPRVKGVEAIGRVSVQKVGFMRFNPFEHTGGDQSFAAAFLDHGNNGIVLSSLYMREGVRVYAKEIQNGVSKHSLTDEERSVLGQAMEPKHE